MLSDVFFQCLLLIIALTANTISAMAGGGAGLLQLPALLFLGLTFNTALATHKVASVALGLGATARHIQGRQLTISTLLLILMSGLPGVILGAIWITEIPEQVAKMGLGVLTLGLGVYAMMNKQLGLQYEPRPRSAFVLLLGCAVLFVLGVINGALSSGTGLFVTLWLIRWFGFDYKLAVAYTMITVGLGWNLTGALTLSLHAPIQWVWLPALILGSLMGGYAGARLTQIKSNYFIQRLFQGMTILVGLTLIFQNF